MQYSRGQTEGKIKKLSGLVSNAGKAAKGFADNAIQMAD